MLLDPGFDLTLRPMKYPVFYEMYKAAIKNTWTVDEVDLNSDLPDLRNKLSASERHLINRLIAFFATGDNIVANNLVLNYYEHVNSPEARMYFSRQLFEEALHIQFYLNLLDTYLPDEKERVLAFKAIENIPSIALKGEFCFKWMNSIQGVRSLETFQDRQGFLKNILCFATCVEGLFFFGSFCYVYFLRSKGLLPGLAAGTNWVFRDECLIQGTEILTENGWMLFEDLKGDEDVAQFDIETEEISFVRPSRYIQNDVDDELIEFSNTKGGIHQIVTKNHDVVQKWDYQEKFSKQKAIDFKINGKKKFAVSGFKKTGRDTLSPYERFLIAFQADGNSRDRYTGERCGTIPATFHFAKERKQKRLREILHLCGFNYQEGFREGSGNRKDQIIFKVDVPIEVSLTKNLNHWIRLKDISASWSKEFIEEVSNWDGYIPRKGNGINPGNYVYYSSTNKSNVDIIQAVAALGGFHCAQTKQVDSRSETFNTIHRAYIHDKQVVGGNTQTKKLIPYKGKVYCVTVPSGCIVIRYNDKVCITGNSCHIDAAYKVIEIAREEEPNLFNPTMERAAVDMLADAIDCELNFAEDVLELGVGGLSLRDMKKYLQFVADQRLATLKIPPVYRTKNPFSFMELQDVQELTNFFERRVTAYQTGVSGEVTFDEEF